MTVTSVADSGGGSLRQAITDANLDAISDTIEFDIAGTGVKTISLLSQLPNIVQPVTIDGYTQTGASANTNPVGQGLNTALRVEVEGSGAGNVPCIQIQAASVTIRGLAINRCAQGSIVVSGAGAVIEGNFLGTNPAGTQAFAGGLEIQAAANAQVGGTAPAARNLISPASPNTPVVIFEAAGSAILEGNLVGTDVTGAAVIAGLNPLTSQSAIGASGTDIVIGGLDANAGNVVAGLNTGIRFSGTSVTIQGNYIGVDAAMTRTIRSPADSKGIQIDQGSNLIGGSAPGAGNVIGGWTTGIFLDGGTSNIRGNFIGADRTGAKDLGNGTYGIYTSVSDQLIGGTGEGEGNVVAFNRYVGILVDASSTGISVRGNRFFGNGVGGVASSGFGMAIDLALGSTPNGPQVNDPGDGDAGANERQNTPLITSAAPEGAGTRVIGTLNSTATTSFDIDFYANPPCRGRPRMLLQAETYIGSTVVTTNASGNATINVLLSTPIAAGSPVTATATDPAGNTSELSAGLVFSSSPGVGGAGDTTTQNIGGQLFELSATITVGGTPVTVTDESFTVRRQFQGPVLAPGSVSNIVLTNPSGSTGTLFNGYVTRFSDYTKAYLYDVAISRLVAAGITLGCGGGKYCPNQSITRAEMAIFLDRAKRGICFVPPNPTGTVFSDVPADSFGARHIEQIAADGVTTGCGNGMYCPSSLVTRDQMAVFLLRTLLGSAFQPPAATGMFDDVPVSHPFARWIEELARRGITGGCGGNNYCPGSTNTRGEMATFLTRTFSLP
jgi:hypothetical protein